MAEAYNKHPKKIIESLLKQIVEDQFSIEWNPRVVRMTKQLNGSNLQHIDYAVPCFDIAENLKISAQELSLILKNNFIHLDFKTESIAGYINFMISDDLLLSTLKLTTNWFESSKPYYDLKNTVVIMPYETYSDPNSDCSVGDLALKFLPKFVGNKPVFDFIYAYDDSSELAEECLYRHFEHNKNKKITALEMKQIKYSLNKGQNFLEKYSDIFNEAIGNKFKLKNKLLYSIGLDKKNIIQTSSLQSELNTFLDSVLNLSDTPKELSVVSSGSTYVVLSDEQAYTLRSVKGFIKSDAYSLYLISSSIVDTNGETVYLVCAPYLKHPFIDWYIKNLEYKLGKKLDVTLFDPKVSRADLCQLEELVNKQDVDIFNSMQEKINNRIVSNIERGNILRIIDYPLDVTDSVASLKMPQYFDLLNGFAHFLFDMN